MLTANHGKTLFFQYYLDNFLATTEIMGTEENIVRIITTIGSVADSFRVIVFATE